MLNMVKAKYKEKEVKSMLTTKSEILTNLDSADSLLFLLQSFVNGELDKSIVSAETIDSMITGTRSILNLVKLSLEGNYENV